MILTVKRTEIFIIKTKNMKRIFLNTLFILSMSLFIFACTEDEDKVDPNSINLALDATVSASSTFSGYSPDNVIDDNLSTELGPDHSWANDHSPSSNVTLPQWVALDFGSEKTFSRIELHAAWAAPFDSAPWPPARSARYVTVLGWC